MKRMYVVEIMVDNWLAAFKSENLELAEKYYVKCLYIHNDVVRLIEVIHGEEVGEEYGSCYIDKHELKG